jgi:hypothetical protein
MAVGGVRTRTVLVVGLLGLGVGALLGLGVAGVAGVVASPRTSATRAHRWDTPFLQHLQEDPDAMRKAIFKSMNEASEKVRVVISKSENSDADLKAILKKDIKLAKHLFAHGGTKEAALAKEALSKDKSLLDTLTKAKGEQDKRTATAMADFARAQAEQDADAKALPIEHRYESSAHMAA